MESNLTQDQSLQDSLVRGSAFEELIRTKGWEFVKAYYQSKVQQLASGLLLNDKKEIGEFENERRELIGLRKVLGMIESDIEILRKHEKNTEPTKE
jgi:hypothetical protein